MLTRQSVCRASRGREHQIGKEANTPGRVTTRQSELELARAHEGGLLRQYRNSGSKTLPNGIVATRPSKLEMRPLWYSGINHVCERISKQQLNLWAIAGAKKKTSGVTEKAMTNYTPHLKYDVFVSFRGEDIRHGFLSHLIKAFTGKQINAFLDEKLKRGDDISDSLVQAIEGSFMSLIIFSEKYASSRWCLKELEKIIECKENYGQIVIPVFYGVDPTDVRHQKKSYENAFVEIEKRFNSSEVQIWRRALKISANLSGITSSGFQNDVELLEEIINHVLKTLSNNPIITKGLIGIGKPIAHLDSLLRQESEKVRVIGIWGMGGIGKTTIAEMYFNQNCAEYDGCCFLEKVSEEFGRHGITFLKEKVFSTLFAEDVKINSPNWLSDHIERRIGRMKVLIVLDDVKEEGQLEMLFGTLDWFRPDSRIIITTRDKQVLIANHEVDDIFEVRELNSSEALELFNLIAFKQPHLAMDYYDISERVVNYANGIPLVLKVLGHLLCGKDKEVWENIACFFNGLSLKVDCMKLLLKDRESDNSMVAGLERLKDKALITISIDNVISMHDIIQEMGREIVRQESSEDPSKRSRLWDPDEICDVFKIVKGTDALPAIRSIRADLSVIRKLKLSSHVFAKMTNLKFLDFNGWYDQDCFDLQGPQSFPSGLRYLHWIHYPLKSFPEKFSAENLVILDLSRGLVEKLWSGVQDLVNLKEVRLSNSILLKELPDFSKATSLNVLLMEHCPRLESVHPSIFSLEKLVQLDLSLCFSLATFTSSSHLSSLHYLNLGFCTNLSKFSATFKNIIELDLTAIPINALPPSIGFQSKLETLVLKLSEIESIPSSIKNLTRLKKLDIQRCKKLLALPELPSSLETLLVECKSLKTVLFPSTAAEQFKENKKRVEFWNCLNLDERSLINIGFNMQINLMKFAYQHLSTLEHDYVESYVDYKDNFSSYQAVYVYPGSSVPEWFEYKTTENEMIVDLSSHLSPLLGFVFCFILVEDYK
ncbi:disease resistance protein RPV1 [Trifolium repens]|nr:disease resistance protein RPV1 [Trifolium repens]